MKSILNTYAYSLMFNPILVRHFSPAIQILLHSWIQDQFLRHGMPRQFPGELVLTPRLLVQIGRFENQFAKRGDVAVVLLDRFQDTDVEGWSGGLVGISTQLVRVDLVQEVGLHDTGVAGFLAGGSCHDSGFEDATNTTLELETAFRSMKGVWPQLWFWQLDLCYWTL